MKIQFKRVHNAKRVFFGLFSLLLAFLGGLAILYFLIFRFKPVFQEKAEFAAKNKANSIINNAVADALLGINTEDFVNIMQGENNSITSINTNTIELNAVKTRIYDNLNKYLSQTNTATVYIPVGSLTKYPMLQGMGYKIPVKIVFDTAFSVDFSEKLKDAGINQVYYETYVETIASFDVISALMISETTITSKIPISQTLIVGTVPAQYGFWYDDVRR